MKDEPIAVVTSAGYVHVGQGNPTTVEEGNEEGVTLAEATLLGNVGWAILARLGNDGQRFARLGSAKRQKTFLRPFTVRLPLFSAETMNTSHFGLGLSEACKKFLFCPFSQSHRVDSRVGHED